MFFPDQKNASILKPRKSTTYGSTTLVMLNTMLKSAPQIPVLMKISYGKIEGVKKFPKKKSNKNYIYIYIYFIKIYIYLKIYSSGNLRFSGTQYSASLTRYLDTCFFVFFLNKRAGVGFL
eukprot:SAG11_NODE_35_length_22255_cov_14.517422_1_plen_120_part_00